MISKREAELILSCALSTGGDFAELFAEDVDAGSIALLDKRVEGANRVHTRAQACASSAAPPRSMPIPVI